jgi:hypothetical protein
LHCAEERVPTSDCGWGFPCVLPEVTQSIFARLPGFDLVGNENALKPLIYYAEALLRFRERQQEEGVDIPFIFHAGETLGDGTEADMNLYDAILLGTKRIGHGLVFDFS